MSQGRIIKNYNGYYYVDSGQSNLVTCKLRGKLKLNRFSIMTGDFVEYDEEGAGNGMITAVRARKNFLDRPTIANLDCIVITLACANPDFSYLLADKLLAFAEKAKVPAVLCLNKADLLTEAELAKLVDVYQKAGYEVFVTVARSNIGVAALKTRLSGLVSAFGGPSGAGKSSLLNAIAPELSLVTGSVSEKIGRGKHTTRYSQLIPFNGGYLADTPGFGNVFVENIEAADLPEYFREFSQYSDGCYYRPCSHTHEPVCGVKTAVAAGKIASERYASYLSILEEINSLDKKRS